MKTLLMLRKQEGRYKHSHQLALICSLCVFSLLARAQQSAGPEVRTSAPNTRLNYNPAALLPQNNSQQGNDKLSEPAVSYDVPVYGARAMAHAPSTTASCNATTSITVASAAEFRKGDGIVVYGCGPAAAMATPSAPTVSPGITNTLTVPDAILTTLRGNTAYTYRIVSRDKFGGLTLPSTATTLTTGLATLGQNQLSISTATLSGNILTVVTSTTHKLQPNELVHITGMSNESVRGWYNISSVTNGNTFVVNNLPVYSASGINATGGTLTYYAGNQLTWTNSGSNVWETIICASRPADSGAYHVIGLSYPVNAVPYGSNTTFTDWGATLTSKPNLPSYISDSICTAVSPTNDYLSTTITNISGTTITVADSASQTASRQTLLFDDVPGIKAAFAAARTAPNTGGVVFIPWSRSGTYYYVNSFLDLSSYNNPVVALRQEGPLVLNETFSPTRYWYGFTGAQSVGTPGLNTPTISVNTAWPGIYTTASTPELTNLTFIASGNQAIPLFLDGGANTQGGFLRNLSIGTGNSSDYSGTGLVMRSGPFNIHLSNISFRSGPGNSGGYVDTTWTPALYFARDTSSGTGESGIQYWELNDLQFYARTFYGLDVGQGLVRNVYTQGNLMPTINLQLSSGVSGGFLKLDGNIVNDRSLASAG